MSIRKIFGSILTLGIVVAFVVAATNAFFSDTETSVGNVLVAGDIDLKIGNTSYVIDHLAGVPDPNGSVVASASTTWSLTDLTVERFFDFEDLKPGDFGEDTIEIQVGSNDAWVCAAARVESNENDLTEPEMDLNDTDETGELDDAVNFVFWVDDGDNVYEVGEQSANAIFLQGPVSALGGQGQIALADSTTSILEEGGAIPGDSSFHIGKYWCMGTITESPETDSDTGDPTNRGTGFDCDGTAVDNMSQTDSLVADLEFYAEQARNNPTFSCQTDWNPSFVGEQPEVGALLSAYDAPDSCSVTLSEGQDIQAALDNEANTVVCLNDGDYTTGNNYPLVMNRNGVTLAGVNPPTNTASLGGGIRVEADNVTITGLDIGKTTGQTGVDDYAVYLASGASGTEISYNVMNRGNGSGRAILTTFNGNNDNVSVMHNVIDNWTTGIFSQTTENMSITNNTVTGNVAGSANDFTVGTSILNNIFRNNQEGIGVFTDSSDILTANFNNIYDNTVVGVKNYGGPTVDAEDNWWGDINPSDDVEGDVDTDPFANSQYTENT